MQLYVHHPSKTFFEKEKKRTVKKTHDLCRYTNQKKNETFRERNADEFELRNPVIQEKKNKKNKIQHKFSRTKSAAVPLW